MTPLAPCQTASLFAPLLTELLAVLRALSPDEWLRPTVAPRWRVRDVAAHLLDGQLRRLSAQRDSHLTLPDEPIASERDLAGFINALNAIGVAYATRLSPRLITDLLEHAGSQLAATFVALDPDAPALYPVSWAGEQSSVNWMDVSREYTEHWHHQMQIRAAVGRPRLLQPKWMMPLLEISVRALPHAYAAVDAAPGTAVTLAVVGETKGDWTLIRESSRWQIWSGRPAAADAIVTITADDVWRLFYNALSDDDRQRIKVEGKTDLAAPLWRARSVIV